VKKNKLRTDCEFFKTKVLLKNEVIGNNNGILSNMKRIFVKYEMV